MRTGKSGARSSRDARASSEDGAIILFLVLIAHVRPLSNVSNAHDLSPLLFTSFCDPVPLTASQGASVRMRRRFRKAGRVGRALGRPPTARASEAAARAAPAAAAPLFAAAGR